MYNWLYNIAVIVTEIEISLILILLSMIGVFIIAAVLKEAIKGIYNEFVFYKKTKAIKKAINDGNK